jgi:hypothetical protein
MTESKFPEVLEIKSKFNKLLESLPAPVLSEEGAPNERKNGKRAKNKAQASS